MWRISTYNHPYYDEEMDCNNANFGIEIQKFFEGKWYNYPWGTYSDSLEELPLLFQEAIVHVQTEQFKRWNPN